MNLDVSLLKARVYHGLKGRLIDTDTLPPRFLEFAICESFGLDHVGDGNFYADGVNKDLQASIKTRMINPHSLKRKEGRNFQTHPSLFLGPHQNVKQNKWTAGLEIVQRRQALDFDDIAASPEDIGKHSIQGFVSNVEESLKKYKVSTSQEIIGVHGYDHTQQFYIVSLFWKELEIPNHTDFVWKREGYGVSGYIVKGDVSYKTVERINGNAKREATCYKEYKDLTKYTNAVHLEIPLPKPWEFNKELLLEEINSYK